MLLELGLDRCLSLVGLFLDPVDEPVHELHIVFEVQLTGLESFLLISDVICQLARLLFLYVYVHLGQVDFFLLVQEIMEGLFFLYVRELYL